METPQQTARTRLSTSGREYLSAMSLNVVPGGTTEAFSAVTSSPHRTTSRVQSQAEEPGLEESPFGADTPQVKGAGHGCSNGSVSLDLSIDNTASNPRRREQGLGLPL